MSDFTFSIPQNIIVGIGSMNRLPEFSKALGGKHAFVISGPHLNKIGLVLNCAKLLKNAGIDADSFTEIEGNPSIETVEKATKAYKESMADHIIALGGGSPMDVAKAVGIVARYGGNIADYEGADKVPGDIIPMIAVPTTAGTGSEVTAFSVITDTKRNYKFTVFSYKLLPSYAILDASLITTAPATVAAACGIDALVHALEAYISKAASPFSDAMAEKAMQLIGGNIREYVENRSNIDVAEAMLVGSTFAGIAFSFARLGNVHAMSHPVSAFFHVPHGVANAVLLPTVVEYNATADTGKYRKIYNYITKQSITEKEFSTSMLVFAIKRLNAKLRIPTSLQEVGVTKDKIDEMTADAMKSGNIAVNPRDTTKEDIRELYLKAF